MTGNACQCFSLFGPRVYFLISVEPTELYIYITINKYFRGFIRFFFSLCMFSYFFFFFCANGRFFYFVRFVFFFLGANARLLLCFVLSFFFLCRQEGDFYFILFVLFFLLNVRSFFFSFLPCSFFSFPFPQFTLC